MAPHNLLSPHIIHSCSWAYLTFTGSAHQVAVLHQHMTMLHPTLLDPALKPTKAVDTLFCHHIPFRNCLHPKSESGRALNYTNCLDPAICQIINLSNILELVYTYTQPPAVNPNPRWYGELQAWPLSKAFGTSTLKTSHY
jgi:hypothetical protein